MDHTVQCYESGQIREFAIRHLDECAVRYGYEYNVPLIKYSHPELAVKLPTCPDPSQADLTEMGADWLYWRTLADVWEDRFEDARKEARFYLEDMPLMVQSFEDADGEISILLDFYTDRHLNLEELDKDVWAPFCAWFQTIYGVDPDDIITPGQREEFRLEVDKIAERHLRTHG